jgi:hypothetical protein
MNKFQAVHPVIYKIDHLSENKYLIYETLKFAFIPFSFTYLATVSTSDDHSQVIMDAVVMKLVNISLVFYLSEQNGITYVNEEVKFKSILPVQFILKRVFRKQHKQLFENMESYSA